MSDVGCNCGQRPRTDPPVTTAQLEQQQREQRGATTSDSTQNAISNAGGAQRQ